MASEVDFDEGSETKGSMWVLEQKLDQPMDEEAGRLKNMYREKVKKQKKKTKSSCTFSCLCGFDAYNFYLC